VQVWVEEQVLPPGVQDRRKADVGAEAARVGRQGQQRGRSRVEEQVVDAALVVQD
jgi:hypothetical protein